MSRRVAFAILALTGAVLALSEPVSARSGGMGGMRGMGGGFRAPMIMHSPRGILPASPRAIARSAFKPRLGHGLGHQFRQHGPGSGRHAIPPSAQGYATTSSLRPHGGLARRHHGAYHQGWYFPTTIGDDLGYGYIGIPYDPGEAIPVYGPAPVYDETADPPRRRAPTARVTGPDDENRDACRSENVTVPAGEGERTIRVVRC